MYRIDNQTAVEVMPTPRPATGKQGFFTEGDPARGIPATDVDMEFLNVVQEELVGICDHAGIALDKAKKDQVLQALISIFGQHLPEGTADGQMLVWNHAARRWQPGTASSGWDAFPVGYPCWWVTDKTDGLGNFLLPSNKFLVRNGDILPISSFRDLWDIFGNMFLGGDGVNTFALPDDRALVIRGADMGRGYDIARVLGSEQQDMIRNIVGEVFPDNPNPNANFIGDQIGATGAFRIVNPGTRQGVADVGGVGYGADKLVFDASLCVPTGPENTMKNRAYIPIVKAVP